MKSTLHTPAAKALSTLLCLSALAGCGAGGNDSQSDGTALLSTGTVTAAGTTSTSTTTTSAVTTATTPTVTAADMTVAGAPVITDVRFENTNSQVAQANVPVTFGQVFAVGALKQTDGLAGELEDGTSVPLQVDVKALHPDGSVRHAIISAILPNLAPSQVRTMKLVKTAKPAATPELSITDIMRFGFSASTHATIAGVRYDAFADDLLKKTAHQTWLSGPLVTEWEVSAPLKTKAGAVHPHLQARFAIRWYQTIHKARVDVTVENDWAYEPNPQNITYDALVLIGGKQAYAKSGMTHYHHARWRKTFWWNGTAPEVNVKQNIAYLLATRALPNYDQSVAVPESALAATQAKWTGAITEPMGIGFAVPYMPQTGGRGDIGLLPAWNAIWLLSMDKRARDAALGTADGAGSWSSHYRDRNTGRPVSLLDYPYMTIYGHETDTYNPATKKREAFPPCATSTACKTPYTHDPDHQPALAYLPYLLTGDYYYLEELQFWAMWDAFATNPGYRQNIKGLVYSEQVRGQAWSLRTLAEAAYITPDNDSLKAAFVQIVNNNLDWYNATYTDNPSANKLGVVTNGYSLVYNSGRGLGPWQDDFFTSAVGHASDLGFTKAQHLLAWKTKFAADRMTAPGACWIDGSIYAMNVRDSSSSPLYATMGEAYSASHTSTFNALACASADMASALGLKVGQMTGYSDNPTGYPSNMQPALAYAADSLGAAGQAAWSVFMQRTVKPAYGTAPQFDIVPR